MAAAIPTTEPVELRSGDTWKWRREDLSDYPAPTWTLKYRFKNAAGGFEITATADGSNFAVTVGASTTATYAAGKYEVVGWVASGGEEYTVFNRTIEVLPNLRASSAATAQDVRSHARKVLEAIEAVIESRATKDQQAYSINGRSLQRTPIADLITLRAQYAMEVQREVQAEKLKQGLGGGRAIFVRFGNV